MTFKKQPIVLTFIKTLLMGYIALAFIISCASSAQVQHTAIPLKPSRGDWSPLSTEGPAMKVEFSLVYDAVQQQLIAFGGRDKNFSIVNQTWAYDFKSKTWTNLNPASSPPGRANHSMVYDSKRHKIVMFGGTNFSRSYNDLWEYDYELNSWTEVTADNPPSARQMQGMVYDTAHEVMIMFGGRRTAGGASFNDTWEYNPISQSWRSLEPQQAPPIQDHVNLAYTANAQKTILFSGPLNHNQATIGTWAYDYPTNTWSKLNTKTSPSSDHSSFISNPTTGQIMLFGNTAESEMETWIFDAALKEWTLLSSTEQPSYREHFGMAYDQLNNTFLLLGGFPNNDTWLLTVK